MKETNEDIKSEEELFINQNDIMENEEKKGEQQQIEEDNLLKLNKLVSDSEDDLIDEEEKKEEEKRKEIRNNLLFIIKDYLFFFWIMISSSMNFSYLYLPLILLGIIQKFFIGKNEDSAKSLKLKLEFLSLIYSILLLIFKIICILQVRDENSFMFENKNIFLDLGICYLRNTDSKFYITMTFLGETLLIVFSLFSIIISHACKQFTKENDASLKKNNFWTGRNLIILNYIFILSFSVFNTSFLTLFYIIVILIVFFLSSIRISDKILDKILQVVFLILLICIIIHVGLINIFNIPRLQENILHIDDMNDKDGNIKVFSILIYIGINYAYNDKLLYVWKEWAGYFFAILSLISLTYSLNNIKACEIIPVSQNTIIEKEKEDENNLNIIPIKNNISGKNILEKNSSKGFFKFISSPIFIIQFCRVISIFYIYFYPNYFSIGILITLLFSSVYLDINKNKKLTIYLLTPMLIATILFYHISNINGLFENFSEERRRKYLNFALGKFEYSFFEYYGHHLFYIFVMFLIYSFDESFKEVNKITINNDLSINNEIEEPLLKNKSEIINDNIIQEDLIQEEEIIIEAKKEQLSFFILILKYIFIHIDKVILVAMYFISMRSINLIHLVLVVIFLIQILFPIKIKKIYCPIIWILHILFFVELFMHLLKAYFLETFNNSKDVMNFIFTYTEKIMDNNMELSIFIVSYCFYFQYQLNNISYIRNIINSKDITIEKYVNNNFLKYPRIQYVLMIFGSIISNIYIWILIGIFFVLSCYFEVNLIFAVKLSYFLYLSFLVLRRIQNPNNGIIFSPAIHYIFLVFCSIHSFLIYLYQFKGDDFINSRFNSSSSNNFFANNLPNIGFSVYLKDNLYFNFLPHFGVVFISVLFINEVERQFKKDNKEGIVELKIMEQIKKQKELIYAQLNDKSLIDEDFELLKSKLFEENEKALKQLSTKYIFSNIMKILTKFYWLLLFLSIGIIFSFYDLSFSMVLYVIIFGIIFILIFYRRVTKLTKYINKPGGSYFISKAVRYSHVERPLSNRLNEYYRNIAFKYLLIYNFILIILLYLYGVFDLFQHGCNNSIFKGCEQSNEPIIEEDGNIEKYIKAFAYLFGIYVDIRKEGIIKVTWVHILLSILIGFDVYALKLEKKYTSENESLRENILIISNENNTLFKYNERRDLNILIKIGLKLAGLSSSEDVKKNMREEYIKEKEKKRKKEKKVIEEKEEDKEKEQDIDKSKGDNIIEIKTIEKKEEVININEKEENQTLKDYQNLKEFEFLKNKDINKFLNLFSEVENNKQKLNDTNNNSTKVIWFLKKMFEELILVLLMSISLTKLNLISFFYVIYFIYLTMTEKTMYKFYILYCFLLTLMIIQSIIYITNISEDSCPRPNSNIFIILQDNLHIPWYEKRLDIEKKYAFFFGLGINRTQMGLLLLEYFLVILEYIYFDFFSFSIYQDAINRGEERTNFKFGKDKLGVFKKNQAQEMDKDLFIQYRECLKNFNVDIGKDINEMIGKLFTDEKKPDLNLELKNSGKTLDTLVYFKEEIKLVEFEDNKIPDSEFTKSFQEFIYLYLHIFFLFFIIIISIMVSGLISIFYLIISFVFLVNSHKIYLGIKYSYPKQIKKLLKICLIVDIIIQLIYQIPYISPEEDSILYKIFNTLGYSKLLKYLENSKIEIASSGLIEIIGKPLIYLIISLQTIIYNSKDFKKYYIIFLLNLKSETDEIGMVNSYIFNNSRINEFKNSFDLRITYEKKMDKIRDKVMEISKQMEGNKLLEDVAIMAPLKYFREKEKEKKEKQLKRKDEKDLGEIKELIDNEEKKEDITSEIIDKNILEENEKVNEDNEVLLKDIKSKGVISLTNEVGKKKRREKEKIIIDPEKIKQKIKNILLNGILMKLYMWFSKKSTSSFKSLESKNKENFKIDSFRNVDSKSFIENEIDENMTILNFSNFNYKEVNIVEEFFTKFKEGRLNDEIDKIKSTIKKEEQNKIKLNNENLQINNNLNPEIIVNNNIKNDNTEKNEEINDVEYIVKRGGTEININTMKFKQFYYLLETNVFKYYFKSSYLIKTIFSILGSFLSSNFDYFIYLIMIIDHMVNCSILSLFYPISIFCYSLLENPRPKKGFWQFCLYYTIFVLIIKFIFQLKLFESIIEVEQYKNFVNTLYTYKIGIQYFDEGFGIGFFNYIILDSLLLLILSLNKNILISNGLWDKREEQIENIYFANERIQKFKDIDASIIINKYRLEMCEFFYRYILNKFQQKREIMKKESAYNKKKTKKKTSKNLEEESKRKEESNIKEEKNEGEKGRENSKQKNQNEQEKKIEESKENEKEEEEEEIDDDGNLNENDLEAICSFYNKRMIVEKKYDEGDKSYFSKLFPKIRNEKPGTDKYPFLAFFLTLIIIYILLFFTQMARDKNFEPVSLDVTQLSGNMVLFLILHIIILVYDRMIYISQNKDNLKFKYFIYKKNEKFIGKAISKGEYNKIKDDYGGDVDEDNKNKPFHFTPGLIQSLIDNDYNLFYIQTENFNKPLLQKYFLHFITTFICHGFAFFYFPMVGNYNSFNSVYCNEEEPESCNNFNNNGYIIVFYILYLIYLYYSSIQIRLGYYDIKRKSLFKRNTPISNLMGQIFNAIPFLPHIRHIIDWTYTSTSFDLQQWIKFESIYNSIFDAYKVVDENDDAPIGKQMENKKQKGIGNILSFALIFIIVIPLILYSSLNPSNKLNNLTAGKLIVDLSFTYENDIKLNYNLFENSRAKSINDMFKNGDIDWKKNNYDKSPQTMNFEHNQTQIIKFSVTSDRNWDLAEPHIKELIDILNITGNSSLKSIDLKISVEFERPLPAEAQTVSHEYNVSIFNSSMEPETSEGGRNILKLKNALEKCSEVSINFTNGYLSPIRLRASKEISEIEDKKYISKKDVQLGFQGCEIEKITLENGTKLINNYLRSYFTFKSKGPKDTDFSEVEFHAFNDKIPEALSGYSIISFYVTFILVAGKYIADFLSSEPEKIMYTDLPHPELIVELCEGITISRYNHNFKEEESLYTILIELMRSPDYLKKLTQSSLKNLELRKQNNVEHDNEEEEEDKNIIEEEKKDEDDENDDYYEDEEGDNKDKIKDDQSKNETQEKKFNNIEDKKEEKKEQNPENTDAEEEEKDNIQNEQDQK